MAVYIQYSQLSVTDFVFDFRFSSVKYSKYFRCFCILLLISENFHLKMASQITTSYFVYLRWHHDSILVLDCNLLL